MKFQGDDLDFVKQAKKIKKEEKKKKKEMKKLKKKHKKLLKKAQKDPEGDWKNQAKMIDTILNVCICIFLSIKISELTFDRTKILYSSEQKFGTIMIMNRA